MTQISATKKSENIFSLCRLKKDCKYPPVSVDFNPILRPTHTCRPIMPTFNNDGKYYTPTFINPYEQSLLKFSPEESEKNEKQKFIKKVEVNLSRPEESNPCFNPKDDYYCSICRISFDDYWKHISSSYHRRKLVNGVGDRYIRELCQPYKQAAQTDKPQKGRKRAEPPKKTKKIKKKGKAQKNTINQTLNRSEDFIIKLPLELFSREQRAMHFNLSTNGATSLNQKV